MWKRRLTQMYTYMHTYTCTHTHIRIHPHTHKKKKHTHRSKISLPYASLHLLHNLFNAFHKATQICPCQSDTLSMCSVMTVYWQRALVMNHWSWKPVDDNDLCFGNCLKLQAVNHEQFEWRKQCILAFCGPKPGQRVRSSVLAPIIPCKLCKDTQKELLYLGGFFFLHTISFT